MASASDLEGRIKALESNAQFAATQDAIREREKEFLVTLREIRESMAKEGEKSASSAEVESLKKENEKLKATIAKQEYRIKHLVSGMKDLLEKQ